MPRQVAYVIASPARTGMDRTGAAPAGPGGRFPRTGGDGPFLTHCVVCWYLLPPHGRGWTQPRMGLWCTVAASPARAGMDLVGISVASLLNGFPRTGGDGPGGPVAFMVDPQLPPHGRGWTWYHRRNSGAFGASPARAGMDPG